MAFRNSEASGSVYLYGVTFWCERILRLVYCSSQFLANACIVLFLIQTKDRLILCLGCFWIRFKKINPVPTKSFSDLESGCFLPMVLVQIPMCNEKGVYQQSIAAVRNLDRSKTKILVQILDDSEDLNDDGFYFHLSIFFVLIADTRGVEGFNHHRSPSTLTILISALFVDLVDEGFNIPASFFDLVDDTVGFKISACFFDLIDDTRGFQHLSFFLRSRHSTVSTSQPATTKSFFALNLADHGNKIQACCKRTHMYHVQHAIPIRKWGVIENVQMNAPGGRTDSLASCPANERCDRACMRTCGVNGKCIEPSFAT
ncbi:hypothetical protein YC2023_117146 [Brassica napus]